MALFISPFVRAMNASGVLSGAKLYFYESGGLVAADVFTTPALDTAHANPVVADSGGLFAPIYLNPTVSYRVILKTSAGVTIQDIDPLEGSGGGTPTDTVSVIDFGAVGDGTTDCTEAFQDAIDAIEAAGGGTINIPFGHYIIDGPLLGSSPATQLALPNITGGANVIQIRFQGVASPLTGDPANGVIIESSLTSGTGAMIGVRDGSAASEINVVMDNIILRTPQNSTITALDLSYVRYSDLNLRVDVPNLMSGANFANTAPTSTNNYGIKFPLNDISAESVCRMVVVAGYYYGVRVGELVSGNLIVSACKYPILAAAGSHPSHFDFVLVTNSPNTIKVDGAVEIWMDLLTIEHDTPVGSGGSGPSWVTPFGYDVDDSTNVLRGGARTAHMHDVSIPFAVNGAKNFKVGLSRPTSEQYDFGLLFSGMESITNMSSCLTARGILGGLPWISFIAEQASTTGNIGFLSWSNGGNGASDIRMAQITVTCEGETDRAKMTFGTSKDGTIGTALTINYLNMLAPNLPVAADDTAAAALSPAVPVGYLYKTSAGAVKARIS